MDIKCTDGVKITTRHCHIALAATTAVKCAINPPPCTLTKVTGCTAASVMDATPKAPSLKRWISEIISEETDAAPQCDSG